MAAGTESNAGYSVRNARTGEEIGLAMQRLCLSGRVLGAGARLLARHVFQSSESRPVEVVYAFMLPRDAALRRFTIRGEGFTAHSELRPAEEAVKAYEEGMERGALSTLARQYGDGLINLTVGNIRPGETVTVTLEILAGVEARDDGFRFRFPFTLAPSYHARMRAIETGPGEGEMELPEDEFGDVILPKFRADAEGLHAVGFDLRVMGDYGEVASVSHGLRVRMEEGGLRVSLTAEGDVPNRDLVLDARRGEPRAEVLGGRCADGKLHFVALAPSVCFGTPAGEARKVVFVLDRSGSMQGSPIEQARKAIEACLGALSGEDEFGLIAFDNRTEVFAERLLEASKSNRERARAYLETIDARGGTELARAVEKAAGLAGAGADLLVLTDGQVFGTEKIVARAREAGVRLHVLGIGSASQDRFLAQLARETGGVSRFMTPRERVDLPAVDLFASIGRPVASDVRVSGTNVAPQPAKFLFAGTPLVVYGEGQSLKIEWTGGELELPVADGGRQMGETARLLRGARLITDETEAGKLKELSLAYGLASREMSLVAVVNREGDRAGEAAVTRVVAVGMPRDTAFGAYFQPAAMAAAPMPGAVGRPSVRLGSLSFRRAEPRGVMLRAVFSRDQLADKLPADQLMELAGRMEGDGGMPGRDKDERLLETVRAVLAFLKEGHSTKKGAFRVHVQRLVAFLERQGGTRDVVAKVIDAAREGRVIPGEWLDGAVTWKEVEAAVTL
ncbi:MAG: VIT and VWA domain-containing protein [Bryobacterales bacterium]|nr:VIT and VWA domain-containing protein [Bryobacterales bacterium]